MKLIATAGAALLCAMMAVTSVMATSLQEIKARGYIVVATEDDFPPYEYTSVGARSGYDHDLLVKFTLGTGIRIKQEIVPWQDIIPGLVSGKYDLAATTLPITRAHARAVDYAIPTAELVMSYMKRKGDDSIRGIKDLSRKKIGVQRGGASADAIPALKEMLGKRGKLGEVMQYDRYAEAYEDLLKHRIDAVIGNRDTLVQLTSETSGIFEVGQAIGPVMRGAWAVKKGNRELLDFINDFLRQQKAAGTFAELQRKYRLNFIDPALR